MVVIVNKKTEVSDKTENENRYQRKFRVVKGLEKEMAWLKKDHRACHFFLFHLTIEFSGWAERSSVKQNNNDTALSEPQSGWGTLALTPDSHLYQTDASFFSPSQDLPVELERQINEGLDVGVVSENNKISDDSGEVNSDLVDNKIVGGCKSNNKFPPADLISANGVTNSKIKDSINIRNSFFSVIEQLLLRYNSDRDILKIISDITSLWGMQFKGFPSPFSWLNSKNKEHCQWLWDEMHKRCVGIPFQPRDHIQQWHFIIATFDNWKGWTIEQLDYLTEKNPKRNPDKLFSDRQGSSKKEIEHKTVLLDELKKAWDQRERRARRVKDPIAARLTKAAQKKLEFIASIEKTTSKDILNQLIDNAFHEAKRKAL